jgi:hypothetical protein
MNMGVQLHEGDSGLSVADRTISLQYRQFRTPRKESKQLIVGNKKTCPLSEAEIRKYEKCLNSSEGCNEKVCVDIEGFSIEKAGKLGNDYLKNNCVFVSTQQVECDSIRDSHLSSHIRKMFSANKSTIEQILMGEALIGTIRQKDLHLMVDNPESLFHIEVSFDTPNNAISKLKNIRKEEKILLEKNGKLKDRAFLKNLLQNIEDISADHGSLDRIPDKEISLNEKVDFNKLNLDGIDVYCLRTEDGTNIFVYFCSDEKEYYIDKNIIIFNGKDVDSLNVLIELGVVGYNPYIGLERAANMIIRNRKEQRENTDREEKTNMLNLDEEENIPERARELLAAIELLVKNKRSKDSFINLGHIGIYMAYPSIQNEILYEMLTRMENDEYKSCYRDTEKFMKTVSNMNEEQLVEFVEKILHSLEFSEENNTVVNTWLMENRKNVCNDLGIEFVQD